MIIQQSNNQRPPRSNRAIKTSQGTRPRHSTKPLLAPVAQNENQEDVLASSDPYKYATKQDSKFLNQNYGSSNRTNALLPFQQRSFNGLLNDFAKKMPRRVSHKTRKNSGQITLFQHQTTAQDNVRQSRERKSKRSTSSNRSRSRSRSSHQKSQLSNADSESNTPKQKKSRRSLNFGQRARHQTAISAENMRFVAKLVNVKATVPHGMEQLRRDIHQKKLKKNLHVSSFQNAHVSSIMGSAPNQSNMIRSHQGSPLSTHSKMSKRSNRSHKRQKSSPQVDTRLKSKGLHNFYKIQHKQEVTPEHQSLKASKPSTPPYLKPRAFDSKHLAQMYEADDHLLFGDKFGQSRKKKNGRQSDTASRASSQRSSQGSVRRRKRKQSKRRFTAGETGYDTATSGFARNPMDIRSNQSNQGMTKNSVSLMGRQQRVGVVEEPIEEHPGPRPNPAGQSLISKMNHLMTQKQKRISKSKARNIQNNGSNIVDQVQHMLAQDQANYTSYGKDDLQSMNMRQAINEQPETDDDYTNGSKPPNHPKKSFVMKLSRSIPRQHGKRKSLQEAFVSHPLPYAAPGHNNQKAALLSGYYNSNAAAQQRTTSKANAAKKHRVTGGSLPPRNVKTATIRKAGQATTEAHQTYSFDHMVGSHKASPNRSIHKAATHHASYPRTTINSSSQATPSLAQAAAAKRRIIIAQNKQMAATGGGSSDDQQSCNINNYTVPMARTTETGWNRQRRNLTTVDNPAQKARDQPRRPDMPQSAHPATHPQKSGGVRGATNKYNTNGQPMRAYQQDARKKYLTDKLFSPVLKSQISSSQAASMPFEAQTIGCDSMGDHINSTVDPDIQEVVFAGGLKPRVTRTAEGGTRARIQGHKGARNNYDMAGDYGHAANDPDLLPQILPTATMQPQKQKPQVMSEQSSPPPMPANQKWLAPTSSFDEKSPQHYQQTATSQSMNQISAAVVPPKTQQLNMESADTFNQIGSAGNIHEDTNSTLAAQEQINEVDQATQKSTASLMNNIGLFTAPKTFNQISEEGGDSDEDGSELETPTINGEKKVSADAAQDGLIFPPASEILSQNYPRLI